MLIYISHHFTQFFLKHLLQGWAKNTNEFLDRGQIPVEEPTLGPLTLQLPLVCNKGRKEVSEWVSKGTTSVKSFFYIKMAFKNT